MLEYGGSWITPGMNASPPCGANQIIAAHPSVASIACDGWRCAQVGLRAAGRPSARTMGASAPSHNLSSGRPSMVKSFNTYLDGIHASPGAFANPIVVDDFQRGRTVSRRIPGSCTYGGLPDGMMTALQHTLTPGASVLVMWMIARSGTNCGSAR
jgi:hypothetical protein